MALKLEVIENYVIYSDTITGNPVGEYALNHCVYTESANQFEIKEKIDNGKLTITKADILAGNWVDSVGTPFTEGTMRDFLRANTGFNTAGGGSPAIDYYTEVAISSAEILSIGNTPKVILNAPDPNNYYDIDRIILEYTHNTTPYTVGATLLMFIDDSGTMWKAISKNILVNANNSVQVSNGNFQDQFQTAGGFVLDGFSFLNNGIKLSTNDNSDPTFGDGSILVKIWYKVKTFGTEL